MVKQILFIISLLISTFAYSQNIPDRVDISYNKSGNLLEVYLIPNYDFDGLFSSIVFTVKSENEQLSQFRLDPKISNYISISKSGPTHYDSGSSYSIFAGFGFTRIQGDDVWKVGQKIKLGDFLVYEESKYDLVNDEFTFTNNGDFYISLNGRDVSGSIVKSETNFSEPELRLYPNPFVDELFVFDGGQTVQFVEILDLTGKIVWRTNVNQYPQIIDTRNLPSGSYFISFTLKDGSRKMKKSVKI